MTLQSTTTKSTTEDHSSSAVDSSPDICFETRWQPLSTSLFDQDTAKEFVSSLRNDTLLFPCLLFSSTAKAARRKRQPSTISTMLLIEAAVVFLLSLLQKRSGTNAFSTFTCNSNIRTVTRKTSSSFSSVSPVISPLQVASIEPHGTRHDGEEVHVASAARRTVDRATKVSASKHLSTPAQPTVANSTVTTSFASVVDFDWQPIAEQVFEHDERPIILFDGVCNLCNGGVNFAIDHDSQAKFRYASLQSKVAQSLLIREGKHPTETQNIVLVTSDTAFYKSQAVAKICAQLDWPLLKVMGRIGQATPKALREPLYKFISRNRFVLGENDSCRLDLDGEYTNRFVSDPTVTRSSKDREVSM
jgi:predicted DCC family thiol-disulfide oxidoreductase YuxK